MTTNSSDDDRTEYDHTDDPRAKGARTDDDASTGRAPQEATRNETASTDASDTMRLDASDPQPTEALETEAADGEAVGTEAFHTKAPDGDVLHTKATGTAGTEAFETDADADAQPFAPVTAASTASSYASTPSSYASTSPTAGSVYGSSSPTRPATPRVRSGAIAWGAIVLLTAVAVLVIALNPAAAAAYATWQASLTPGTVALLGVVTLGVLVLLFAVLSVIRRAQRRARGEAR